jgi:hypothetical protein
MMLHSQDKIHRIGHTTMTLDTHTLLDEIEVQNTFLIDNRLYGILQLNSSLCTFTFRIVESITPFAVLTRLVLFTMEVIPQYCDPRVEAGKNNTIFYSCVFRDYSGPRAKKAKTAKQIPSGI